jgi:hypothetical protein
MCITFNNVALAYANSAGLTWAGCPLPPEGKPTEALLCGCLTLAECFTQEDTKALGGVAPVGYLAGVAGFELLPIFAPRPVAPVSGFVFGVLRLRLWLSLLAGLFFGPLQVRYIPRTC